MGDNLRHAVRRARLIPEIGPAKQRFSNAARSSFTMTKNIALSRPAMSAIAAFLVMSTPNAFAQEIPTVTMTPPVAAPTPQTPPTVPEPTTTAPVAAPPTAQPATAAPVIRVPLDIPVEATTPAPKAAERAAAPAPARTERAAARTRSASPVAAPVSAAATPVAAPSAEAGAIDEATPLAAPMTAPAEPIAEPAPLSAETPIATATEFPWEIAGGAAALLIIGGAGFAFARRRRVVDAEATTYDYEPAAVAAAEPATGETQPWITPAYAPREEVAPRTVPTFAAAPSGSMGRHEAMAMAGPTDENPFATLSKRLKRARFLDRQERVAYDETLGAQKDMARKPVSAWEIAQRPAPATQEQDVRRPEPARVRTSTSFRPGYSNN